MSAATLPSTEQDQYSLNNGTGSDGTSVQPGMTEPQLGDCQTGMEEKHRSEPFPGLTPQKHVHRK
jgi:hypothetical protein